MTRRHALLVALAAVLVVSAWLDGRSRASTREVRTTETVTVERVVVRERAQEVTHGRENVVSVVGPVRTVTRWIPGPGCPGPTVEQTTESGPAETRSQAIVDQRSAAVKESFTARDVRSAATETIVRERPRWSVGLDGGLQFEDATLLVRGSVSLRALGPLWVTAWGERRAAGIGARVEF